VKWLFSCVIVLLAAGVLADRNPSSTQPWLDPDDGSSAPSKRFTEDDKRIIRSYFRAERRDDATGRDKPKKQKSLPPGLQKKLERGGELPPGWQKKVARGEVLDPELYRRSRPLPYELRKRLAGFPYGTDIRRVDDRVVRILEDTQIILDVLNLD
jgi:hypothetical protein